VHRRVIEVENARGDALVREDRERHGPDPLFVLARARRALSVERDEVAEQHVLGRPREVRVGTASDHPLQIVDL